METATGDPTRQCQAAAGEYAHIERGVPWSTFGPSPILCTRAGTGWASDAKTHYPTRYPLGQWVWR